MTKEYVKDQIATKKAQWQKRYEYLKLEVETQSNGDCFEQNLINSLLPMLQLREDISELEQVLIRLEIEENSN